MSGCDRASDLSALVDDAIVPDEVAALEEHVAGCAFCQGEREGLVLVRDQLRAIPRATPPAHLTAAVMAGVIALEDERAAAGASTAPMATKAPPATEVAPAPVEAAAPAKKKLAPFPVRPKISERRAAQPPPPPNPRKPTTCADVAEDLSASFDAELSPEGRARLDLHLVGCTACQQLRFQLEMMLGEVRLLPRAAVPADFAKDVLARVAADSELERLRERASQARAARWWRGLGIVAQAAGLLLVIGTGLAVSAPPRNEHPRWTPPETGGVDGVAQRRADNARADEQMSRLVPKAPEVAPPLSLPSEATVVLRAPKGIVEGLSDATNAGHSFGRVLGSRLGVSEAEVVVSAQSSRIDDLVEALDRTDGLDATPGARTAIERVSTDQDRLTLKSGFVLVGEVQETAEGYVVTQGELRQVVRRQAVAASNPLERASRERTVRLLVEAGP